MNIYIKTFRQKIIIEYYIMEQLRILKQCVAVFLMKKIERSKNNVNYACGNIYYQRIYCWNG